MTTPSATMVFRIRFTLAGEPQTHEIEATSEEAAKRTLCKRLGRRAMPAGSISQKIVALEAGPENEAPR